jgi:POT family proton-dependent oligopeptide transporter
VVTISEILVSPMGLSFVSKVSPPRMRGLMMGCWFGATAIGSYSSGLLGRFYGEFQHHEYFIGLAVLLFLSSTLVLLFMKKLKQFSGN